MGTARLFSAAFTAIAILPSCGGEAGAPAPAPGPITAPTPAPPPPPPPPPPAPGTAEGLWLGTTSTNRALYGLIFSDGSAWFIYSAVGSPNTIAGAVQGAGSSLNGSFSSGNARDFNLEGAGVQNVTVSGSYVSKQSLSGAVTSAAGGVSFTAAYSTNYETQPTLAAITGTFAGPVAVSAGSDQATVAIAANGTFSGTSAAGCNFNGAAAPRADGNAYNVSITFGAAPCFFATQTLSGIGYYNTAANQVIVAAPNSARTDGVLFAGTRR